MTDITALIDTYYAVFNADSSVTPEELGNVLAPEWTNTGSAGAALDIAAFSGLLGALREGVPDLAWTVQEAIVAGDRVVVRGEGTGTPVAPLFGTPPTGRPFRIMSIDIHTVSDGRIASSYHLEDWAGVGAQLQAG